MVRQVRRQMRADGDRADARPAAAVGDAEGLVQVQVRDVGTESTWASETDEGVEVRAVDIDLTARVVDLSAHVAHGRFEDAVCRRVGDHDRCELRRVGVDLAAQIVHIDVPGVVARNDDHAHPGHRCTRGVGSVCRRRDQADVALRTARGVVEGPDREQTSELALRPGIGLQRDRVVSGDVREPRLKLPDEGEVALRLLDRRERMDLRELRPADRFHLGRRVQLHRARAERNHRSVESDVLVGQAAQIPQHRRLRAMLVKDLVAKEI